MIEIIPNWHPIFVHFTVALLSVSLGLFILGAVTKSDQAILVAKWNLWIGSGITLLTLAAGFYAYNTVAHDTPSHEAMTEHRNWALATVVALLPVLIWSVWAERKAKTLGWGFFALFGVTGVLLSATAWHGGEAVYRYGLGVMSLPKTDSHDHGAHGNGEAGGAHGHDRAPHQDNGHGHDEPTGAHAHDEMRDDMSMDEMRMPPDEAGGHGHDDDHAH